MHTLFVYIPMKILDLLPSYYFLLAYEILRDY